jgi:hypothetical protein
MVMDRVAAHRLEHDVEHLARVIEEGDDELLEIDFDGEQLLLRGVPAFRRCAFDTCGPDACAATAEAGSLSRATEKQSWRAQHCSGCKQAAVIAAPCSAPVMATRAHVKQCGLTMPPSSAASSVSVC